MNKKGWILASLFGIILILAGCGGKEDIKKPIKEKVKVEEKIEKEFVSEAVFEPIALKTKAEDVKLTLQNVEDEIIGVEYSITREKSERVIPSKEGNNYTITLPAATYNQGTGAYEVTAYGKTKDRNGILLQKTAFAYPVPVPILMYHAVDEYKGVGFKELYVTPSSLKEQMIYLRDNGYTPITFHELERAGTYKKPIILTFDDGYKNNLNILTVFNVVKTDTFTPKAVIYMITGNIGTSDTLSESEIRKMRDSGFFSFQSHTVTHPDMTTSTNVLEELTKSKETLEALTNEKVISFAYPLGKYTDEIATLTKGVYPYAVTIAGGIYHPEDGTTADENVRIPRLRIKYSTTIDEFRQMIP